MYWKINKRQQSFKNKTIIKSLNRDRLIGEITFINIDNDYNL